MIGRNNPLNIRYSPLNNWKGQSGYTRGFCNFRTLKYGVRAAAKLLMITYPCKGLRSYKSLINRFAPPSENPTSNYVSYVCKKCNVKPDDFVFGFEAYATLIYYMWCFEQGSSPTMSIADIEEVIQDLIFKE